MEKDIDNIFTVPAENGVIAFKTTAKEDEFDPIFKNVVNMQKKDKFDDKKFSEMLANKLCEAGYMTTAHLMLIGDDE